MRSDINDVIYEMKGKEKSFAYCLVLVAFDEQREERSYGY